MHHPISKIKCARLGVVSFWAATLPWSCGHDTPPASAAPRQARLVVPQKKVFPLIVDRRNRKRRTE